MIKSVDIIEQPPAGAGQFISIEIADNDGNTTKVLYFDEKELLDAAKYLERE